MLSLVGYEGVVENPLDLLKTIHASINRSATRADWAPLAMSHAQLLEACSDQTGRFFTDYLRFLMEAYEAIGDTLLTLVPDDEKHEFFTLVETLNTLNERLADRMKVGQLLSSLRVDSVEVLSYWVDHQGDQIGDVTLRNIMRDRLLQTSEAVGMTFIQRAGMEVAGVVFASKFRASDDGQRCREEYVIDIGGLLDSKSGRKSKYRSMHNWNPHAMLINTTLPMLEGVVTAIEMFHKRGIELLKGSMPEKLPTSRAEIKVTENAKYEIGLFG